MKSKTISTQKANILIVDLPKEAINVICIKPKSELDLYLSIQFEIIENCLVGDSVEEISLKNEQYLPKGQWKELRLVDEDCDDWLEINETAKQIVEDPIVHPPFRPLGSTLIYLPSKSYYNYAQKCWMKNCTSALESLQTLISTTMQEWEMKENISFENPMFFYELKQ